MNFLCVNASNIKKDYDHLKLYSERFGCVIENLSNYFGQLVIQGPLSEEILSSVIDRDLSALKRMFFVEDDFNIGHALISRTGYTEKMDTRSIVQWKILKIGLFLSKVHDQMI